MRLRRRSAYASLPAETWFAHSTGLLSTSHCLPDCKTHFVERGAIRAPKLDSPVAGAVTTDGVAAVRTVTVAGIGLDAELHSVAYAIALIPAVLDRRGGRGCELCVKEHRPRPNLAVRSLASPHPKGGAELRPDHRWHRGRSCGRGWPGAARVGFASSALRLRGRLRRGDRFGRRTRWPRGRSLGRWSYRGRRGRLGLLGPVAPEPGHHENDNQQRNPAQRTNCKWPQGSFPTKRHHVLRLRRGRRLAPWHGTTGGRVQPGCDRWR